MAIVKASYTRSREKIKATLRYIIHRPGRVGERLTRTLFGNNREVSKEEAYRLIDAQRGMTYFHLKLNFHPTREDKKRDLDLRAITKQSITTLQERFHRPIRFLAVEHNDHTDLRHIHAIVLIKLGRGERIGWQDWKLCRESATEAALLERRALDRMYQFHRNKIYFRHSFSQQSLSTSMVGGARGQATHPRTPVIRVMRPRRSCPECGMIQQPVITLKNGMDWCRVHGIVKVRANEIEKENSAGLGL